MEACTYLPAALETACPDLDGCRSVMEGCSYDAIVTFTGQLEGGARCEEILCDNWAPMDGMSVMSGRLGTRIKGQASGRS